MTTLCAIIMQLLRFNSGFLKFFLKIFLNSFISGLSKVHRVFAPKIHFALWQRFGRTLRDITTLIPFRDGGGAAAGLETKRGVD